MVDGEVREIPDSASRPVDRGNRELSVVVPRTLVESFLSPHRVVGRICGEEWRLGQRSQETIGELMKRFDEELTWATKEPATKARKDAAPAPPPRRSLAPVSDR